MEYPWRRKDILDHDKDTRDNDKDTLDNDKDTRGDVKIPLINMPVIMIKIPVARRRRRLACFWLQMLPSRDAHQVHPEVKNMSTSEYFHIHHVIIQPGVAGEVERTVHGTNLFPRRPHLPKMSLPPLPCLTTLALCNRIHSSYLSLR